MYRKIHKMELTFKYNITEKYKHTKQWNSILLKEIQKRLNENKNCIIAVVGETGSGKSYAGLKILEVFNSYLFREKTSQQILNERLAFTPKKFLQILKNSNLKHGDVVVFDEPQVAINSRNYHDTTNKMFNEILGTFRYKKLVTVFCTPNIGHIDSQARHYVNIIIRPKSINMKDKYITASVQTVSYNMYKKDYLFKNLRVDVGDGMSYNKLDSTRITKISDELEKAYEKISHSYKDSIQEKNLDKLKKVAQVVESDSGFSLIEREMIKLKIKGHKKSEIAKIIGVSKVIVGKFYTKLRNQGVKVTKKNLEKLLLQ